MPDITLCKGDGCAKKCLCKRYVSKPNENYQSYFTEPPFTIDKKNVFKCDFFICTVN